MRRFQRRSSMSPSMRSQACRRIRCSGWPTGIPSIRTLAYRGQLRPVRDVATIRRGRGTCRRHDYVRRRACALLPRRRCRRPRPLGRYGVRRIIRRRGACRRVLRLLRAPVPTTPPAHWRTDTSRSSALSERRRHAGGRHAVGGAIPRVSTGRVCTFARFAYLGPARHPRKPRRLPFWGSWTDRQVTGSAGFQNRVSSIRVPKRRSCACTAGGNPKTAAAAAAVANDVFIAMIAQIACECRCTHVPLTDWPVVRNNLSRPERRPCRSHLRLPTSMQDTEQSLNNSLPNTSVSAGSHPSYRHEEPASPNTCVTLSPETVRINGG